MPELSARSAPSRTPSLRTRAAWLATILAVAMFLGGRELQDEAAVSLQGDMPRYLLNGVFLLDMVRDAPVAAPLEYAQRDHARYPALSIGHHPLLTAVAEVPFFAAFGVSVRAGRLVQLAFLGAAAVFWFLFVASLFGDTAAGFATLLLVTAPRVVWLTQAVLSEMAAVACIAGSLYFLERYARSGRGRDATGFGACFVASLYAKQLAVVMVPVYMIWLVSRAGWRSLLTRTSLATLVACALLIAPLAVALTARVAVFNVTVAMTGRPPQLQGKGVAPPGTAAPAARPAFPSVAEALREGGIGAGARLERYLDASTDLAGPLALALAALGAAMALVRRDARGRAVVLWAAVVLAEVSAVGWVQPRYLVYFGPALWLLTVVPLGFIAAPRWRSVWTAALALAVAQQAVQSAALVPAGAGGYEEAARFVADHPGRPVLYSAVVDSGYFVFFVRKHDPARHSVVLRADKLLTTSRMNQLNVADQVSTPGEVLDVLRDCGVRFVVIEDGGYPVGPLTWLQDVVRTPRFVERQRLALRSRDKRLAGKAIVIYELLDAPPPDPRYVLRLGIPLVGQTVEVKLAELLPPLR